MSHRTAAASAGAGPAQMQSGHVQQRQYAVENPLMPGSLKRIPSWYQDETFRYNPRFLLAFAPGALLLGTVAGKSLVAVVILGILVTLFLRSMGFHYLSMLLSVAHIFVVEVLNVYLMLPLMWRSVLNIPLFMLFHMFIGFSGLWMCLQGEEFRKQDPRFTILLERLLFYVYPAVSITMVTWIAGMLFGKFVLPYVICIAGLVALSLFLSPLQSSFAKPNTPTDTGLIQHWAVAVTYFSLQLTVPGIVYAALSFSASFQSILSLLLFVVCPVFLLTLLEAQGLFYWTGLSSRVLKIIRWISAALVLTLVSLLLFSHATSSYLPHLLLPIIFAYLALVSVLESPPSPFVPLVLSGSLVLLYSVAFLHLPWSISHNFSFMSLPLTSVQVLLWCLAMATIAMVTLWQRINALMWTIYSGVLVLCEFVLFWEGVYPAYIAMATTSAAVVLFWRFHSIGRLPLTSSLLLISLHFTKFSLLLPTSSSASSPHSPIALLSIFLVAFVLLKVILFGEAGTLSLNQLCLHSGVLLIGLLLSFDSLLVPVWATLVHRLPSLASLLAAVFFVVGLFISHGLSLLREKDRGRLPLLSPSLFVMAVLFGAMQPEFDPEEVVRSMMLALLSMTEPNPKKLPMNIVQAAWTNILVWLTLIAAIATMGSLVSRWRGVLVFASTAMLGASAGLLTAVMFLHSIPLSPLGLLYAVSWSSVAILLGRAYTAKRAGTLEPVLFIVVAGAFLASFYTEWITFPRFYIPGATLLSHYALPCTRLYMVMFTAIAAACRAKMYHSGEKPHLPLICNTSCLAFFLLSLLNPLHAQLEVSIIISSAIFLLAQPDGIFFPTTTSPFLAPSLLASVLALYCVAASSVLPQLYHSIGSSHLNLAGRIMELLCLLTSSPGQALFIFYLWTGKQLKLSILHIVIYIVPNALLPQFSHVTASSLLGGIGVFSFVLLIVGDYKSLKIM